MNRFQTAVLAAAMALAAPFAAAAQAWSDWGEAEIRVLTSAENGVVTEVARGEAGELYVYATFDDWLNLLFIGHDCVATGGKPRCPTLAFNALFEVDDQGRSRTLERDLTFQYVADMADGEDFVIHRQVELQGGAPLTNIRHQLNGFILVAEKVADEIWPPKAGEAAGAGDKGRQPPP